MDPVGANVDVVGSHISAEAIALDEYANGPPNPPTTGRDRRAGASWSDRHVGPSAGRSRRSPPPGPRCRHGRSTCRGLANRPRRSASGRPRRSAARALPSVCLRRPYAPNGSSSRLGSGLGPPTSSAPAIRARSSTITANASARRVRRGRMSADRGRSVRPRPTVRDEAGACAAGCHGGVSGTNASTPASRRAIPDQTASSNRSLMTTAPGGFGGRRARGRRASAPPRPRARGCRRSPRRSDRADSAGTRPRAVGAGGPSRARRATARTRPGLPDRRRRQDRREPVNGSHRMSRSRRQRSTMIRRAMTISHGSARPAGP